MNYNIFKKLTPTEVMVLKKFQKNGYLISLYTKATDLENPFYQHCLSDAEVTQLINDCYDNIPEDCYSDTHRIIMNAKRKLDKYFNQNEQAELPLPPTQPAALPATPAAAMPTTPLAALPATPAAAMPATPPAAMPATPAPAMPATPAAKPQSLDVVLRQQTPANINHGGKRKPNAKISAEYFLQLFHVKIYQEGIYIFDGGRYQYFSDQDIKRLLHTIFKEEAEQCGTSKYYKEIIDFIRCVPGIVVKDAANDPTKISFLDGYLDLKTLNIHKPDYTNFFTTIINMYIDELSAVKQTPVFDSFINRITGGDLLLQERILEVIGYCLTNDMAAKSIFLFQGVSNSGKSTLINLISSFFEDELIAAVPIDELSLTFSMKELFGKALNINGELSSSSIKPQTCRCLKQLTGGDWIQANVKYKDYIKFKNTAKILLATNNALFLEERDEAFIQRFITVPFAYSLSKEEIDYSLLDKIKAERPGILIKALNHYITLKNNNYQFTGNYPLNAQCQSNNRQQRTDILKTFIDEMLVVDYDSFVPLAEIYTAFKEWLMQTGELNNPYPSDMSFGKSLRNYLHDAHFEKSGHRYSKIPLVAF